MKVAIYGASGYTGQELMRLLFRHPDVDVTVVTSRKFKGANVADVFPQFVDVTDLQFSDLPPEEAAAAADFVFLALPHGTSMHFAPIVFQAGKKLIDLSADYRLRNLATYEQWYGRHASASLIEKAVYGVPELYREAIAKARFVAAPGCYPTSAILGLAPIVKEHLVRTSSIIIDSKSGVSGAGREPQITSLFCEVNEGFKAYKIAQHRHTPEIEQELSLLAGHEVIVSFTPHLVPLNRGILSTIYADLTGDATAAELIELYRRFYAGERFIRLYKAGMFPNISSVRGSNYCDIGIAVDARTRRVVIVSVIDNLLKGASGIAVQSMNLMCGFPEDAGLKMVSLFP
jgi:N-acetyl-gamma-glutamyl-phosphate reductase